ncbi:MAG: sporulation protein YabP [Bacillota bacterium]|nr:sporulation protein YabP [Bacillota bacterium]
MEEKKRGLHSLYLEDRNRMVVTDVKDVENFNEETILLTIGGGGLVIKGQKLHIQKLDLEEGKVIIDGRIQSAVYTEKRDASEGGFLKKLLK